MPSATMAGGAGRTSAAAARARTTSALSMRSCSFPVREAEAAFDRSLSRRQLELRYDRVVVRSSAALDAGRTEAHAAAEDVIDLRDGGPRGGCARPGGAAARARRLA